MKSFKIKNYKSILEIFAKNLNFHFLATGIFLGVIFNFPEYLSYLSLFAFLPIFYYLEKKKNGLGLPLAFFTLSYYFTYNIFLFDLLPLEWAFIYDPYYGFFLIFVALLYFTLSLSFPQIFIGFVLNKFNKSKSFLFIFLFTLLEFIKTWSMSFFLYSDKTLLGPHHTYGDIGYIVVNIPILKNIIPYFGSIGSTVLLLLINYMIFKIIFSGFKKFKIYLVIVIVILSLLEPKYIGEKREVYLGNYNLDLDLKIFFSAKDFKTNFSKIENNNLQVLLPENFRFYGDRQEFPNYRILGTENIKNKQTMYSWDGESIEILHEKSHLMPMGEYRLSIFEIFFPYIGGQKWDDFFNSTENKILPGKKVVNNTPYAYLICGEIISSFLTSDLVGTDKKAIFMASSLRPFNKNRNWNERLKLYYRMRAMETGKYLLLAGYNTESLVVDANGNVLSKFKAEDNNFKLEKVEFYEISTVTFYSKLVNHFSL